MVHPKSFGMKYGRHFVAITFGITNMVHQNSVKSLDTMEVHTTVEDQEKHMELTHLGLEHAMRVTYGQTAREAVMSTRLEAYVLIAGVDIVHLEKK